MVGGVLVTNAEQEADQGGGERERSKVQFLHFLI